MTRSGQGAQSTNYWTPKALQPHSKPEHCRGHRLATPREDRASLGANSAPNARAETGGSASGPRPAAPKPTELSGPMGDARASHCLHPGVARGRNAAAQMHRVKNERSARRIKSAAAYPEAIGIFPQWPRVVTATVFHRRTGPQVRAERKDACESGRQSQGAPTIANHRSPHPVNVYTHLGTIGTATRRERYRGNGDG
jgi:hypothetical protein